MKFVTIKDNQEYVFKDNDCVVVVDVLRACSTMYYAANLNNTVYLASSVEECNRIGKKFRNAICMGEQNGNVPKEFGLNNSPSEVLFKNITGKKLILSTTKGSKAFSKFNCSNIIVGSLVSAKEIAKYIISQDYDTVYFYPCNQNFNRMDEDYICCEYIRSLIEKPNYNFHKKYHKFMDAENNRFFKESLQKKIP